MTVVYTNSLKIGRNGSHYATYCDLLMGQTLEVFRVGGLERQEELKNDTRRAAGQHS